MKHAIATALTERGLGRWGPLVRKTWVSLRSRGPHETARKVVGKLHPVAVPPTAAPWMPTVDVELPTLPTSPHPVVSIVIPVLNHWAHSCRCLHALAQQTSHWPYEVLLVDDGSTDDTKTLATQVAGLRYVPRQENGGFIAACTDGARAAGGEYLVFLNNDTVPQPGWLDELIDTLISDTSVGLVGAQLIDPRGRVQEAGGIVFSDGTAANFGRGFSPSDPRVSFVREVDYCSGATIAIERALFEQLGGFDQRYRPAYFEDTDLAMSVREAGLRVVYQPLAKVAHEEGTTSGTDTRHGVKAFQVVNQRTFSTKWAGSLADHPRSSLDLIAASTWRRGQTVLVVDGETPTPNKDSGSVRLVNLMELLIREGAHVIFWPIDRGFAGAATVQLQQRGVEVWHAPAAKSLVAFLRTRGKSLDTIVACRYHVAQEVFPLARHHAPRARLIFDTVDLHHVRERRQAELTGNTGLLRLSKTTKRLELAAVNASDVTLVVTAVEADLLRPRAPATDIEVLSNIHRVEAETSGFPDRSGLLFVGGFRHEPNADAVRWFVSQVFPLIRAQLPLVEFHCVGDGPPADIAKFDALPGVRIHGFVEDLGPLMESARVGLAPLRFGAGVKGKINLSMANGQPVVATAVAVEGMHLVNGEDVLVADTPEDFATAVVRAYTDSDLWRRLAAGGRRNVERYFSFDAARETVRRVILGD